jgi:carbonic anhydrase
LREYFLHVYRKISGLASGWNYDNGDPYRWGDRYPTCYGSRQSPIDINVYTVQARYTTRRVVLTNMDKVPVSANYKNDGHGYSLSYTFRDGDEPPVVTGGPLGSDAYKFVNIHFHWKSEHTFNGRSNDAEMHVVFFNTKYGSFDVAVNQPDGLAVLGFVYYVS